MDFIRTHNLPLVNYFSNNGDSKSDEETARLLHSMEEGGNPMGRVVPKEDPIGTVKFPCSVVGDSDRNRMVDADPEARAAAGNAAVFVERFESLLRDQYKDKDGRSRMIIGTAIYKILGKAEPKDGIASIIDPKTATDIGLLAGDGAKTAISAMDRTLTKMGNAYLQLILTRPSADLDVVLGYQQVIRFFIENQAVFQLLESELEKMPKGEINLISCQDTRKQLPGSTTALYYNIDPRLNETLNMSSIALDISVAGVTVKKVANTVMQALSVIALPLYGLSQVSRAFGGPGSPEFLQQFADRFTASTPVGVLGTLAMTADIALVNAAISSAAGAYSGMSVRSTYDWLIADSSILPLMRDVLSSIATYYKGMKAVHALLKEYPEITEKLKHFKSLDVFICNKKEIKEIDTLFSALESFTFSSENQYIFRPGEVLMVWELLHSGGGKKTKGKGKPNPAEQVKETAGDKIRAAFEEALPAMGEIDAFLSVAKLIKESENSRVKYCLPEIVLGGDQPSLQFSRLWHPGIGQDKAIANDIALGEGAESSGMILSGPNTGGKSSFAQALVLAIVTSRMGFCPAEKARLSDFGYIRTSMDIKGSIDREESLFAAQCKLLGEIDSDVQNLPKTTHSFVALDEPCSQTNPKQGSALAMAIGAKLSKVKGNMTIIITHFRNIAETIGDKSDSVDGKLSYKNYKMERGGTFKLAPGISEESANNAFEVAKQFGMESQIVEEAKDYVRDV
jgi:hypothetical protein